MQEKNIPVTNDECKIYNNSSYGVMVNVQDIRVREFEFQSCYYIHFQTNTLMKGMNSLT